MACGYGVAFSALARVAVVDEDSCPGQLHHMLVLNDCFGFRNGEGDC